MLEKEISVKIAPFVDEFRIDGKRKTIAFHVTERPLTPDGTTWDFSRQFLSHRVMKLDGKSPTNDLMAADTAELNALLIRIFERSENGEYKSADNQEG